MWFTVTASFPPAHYLQNLGPNQLSNKTPCGWYPQRFSSVSFRCTSYMPLHLAKDCLMVNLIHFFLLGRPWISSQPCGRYLQSLRPCGFPHIYNKITNLAWLPWMCHMSRIWRCWTPLHGQQMLDQCTSDIDHFGKSLLQRWNLQCRMMNFVQTYEEIHKVHYGHQAR